MWTEVCINLTLVLLKMKHQRNDGLWIEVHLVIENRAFERFLYVLPQTIFASVKTV
jgi:hypothetical protein